jgi:DNA-binding winged helix-turn-helix (wHTH) protein
MAVRGALEHAGAELRDPALLAACARAGIDTGLEPAPIAPFRDLVRRLGLDRGASLVAEAADRRWLLAHGEPLPSPFDLTIALDRGSVISGRGAIAMSKQRLQLLEHLARAGAAGASMEEMHRSVWGFSAYHPLRHRNTIYVAITRLRESLRRLLDGDVLVEIAEGHYRLQAATLVVSRTTQAALPALAALAPCGS